MSLPTFEGALTGFPNLQKVQKFFIFGRVAPKRDVVPLEAQAMSGRKMNKYSEILKNWQAPDGMAESEALHKIEQRLSETPIVVMAPANRRPWWMAAAGVAAAVAIAWVFLLPNNRVIKEATDLAMVKKIELPDGSQAALNASSTLQFEENWGDERMVELQGEAFFEVKKGSSFQVRTNHGTVTVLGTSFNVLSRGDDHQVSCKTGKVSVQCGAEEVIITPGQRVTLRQAHLEVETFQLDRKDWTDGVFYFENADLSDILEEMERQFSIHITGDQELWAIRGMTTNFSKDNLEQAFLKVGTPAGLEFIKIKEQHYRLQRKGAGS
jgi:transmembrane sensor